MKPGGFWKIGFWVSVGLVVVLAVLLWRQKTGGDPIPVKDTQEQKPEKPPIDVQIVKLATEQAQEYGEFSGSVQSRKVVQVSSEILARIEELPVDAGQKVKKGALLARMDGSVIDAQVRQAEESVGVAEAMVRQAEAQVQQAEARVRQAQAKVRSAEALRDEAQRDLKRYQDTFKAGASTQQQLQQVEARVKTTNESVRAAKEEVDASQRQVEVTKRQVDAAERKAEAMRQQVKAVRQQSAKTKIVSPMTAVVVDRLAEPGDLATPGRTLMTLQSATELQFETPVSERCARRVQVGDEVRVKVEAAGREMVTRVNEIVPAVDPQSRTFLVRADLPSLQGLQPGMFGRLQFTCGLRPVLRVPETALLLRGQLEFVFVAEAGRACLRLVRSGKRQAGQVEILSGVQEGETIVVLPPPTLMDGDPVTVGSGSANARPLPLTRDDKRVARAACRSLLAGRAKGAGAADERA